MELLLHIFGGTREFAARQEGIFVLLLYNLWLSRWLMHELIGSVPVSFSSWKCTEYFAVRGGGGAGDFLPRFGHLLLSLSDNL